MTGPADEGWLPGLANGFATSRAHPIAFGLDRRG
jgi:hypothetical protein